MAGLYIHIPFCHSKCAYCDFYSRPRKERQEAGLLVEYLLNELSSRNNEANEPFSTVYLGGGTPSSLPVKDLDTLINGIKSVAPATEEYTIEVNPEDVTDELCDFISSSPINRVSMGVQSLDDVQLKFIGRRHDAKTALDAVERLRRHGIDEISCDLIYGLPMQDIDSWRDSLSRLLELGLPHLSAYLLSYEPGTRLSAMLYKGKVTETDEDTAVAMYNLLIENAASKGYRHYEISNFAIPGHEARHNSSYWNGTPYLGIGPGAHSYDGAIRRVTRPDIKGYLKNRGLNCFDIEEESVDERFNDFIITSLRTADGLNIEECSLKFGERYCNEMMVQATKYIDSGALSLLSGRLKIDERHWLVSDRILVDLIR